MYTMGCRYRFTIKVVRLRAIINRYRFSVARKGTAMTKFVKGQSGNPAGRPVGSKNKCSQFRELLEDDLPALVSVLLDKALEGDMNAMRLLLERLVPKVQVVDMNLQSAYEPITKIEHVIIQPKHQ